MPSITISLLEGGEPRAHEFAPGETTVKQLLAAAAVTVQGASLALEGEVLPDDYVLSMEHDGQQFACALPQVTFVPYRGTEEKRAEFIPGVTNLATAATSVGLVLHTQMVFEVGDKEFPQDTVLTLNDQGTTFKLEFLDKAIQNHVLVLDATGGVLALVPFPQGGGGVTGLEVLARAGIVLATDQVLVHMEVQETLEPRALLPTHHYDSDCLMVQVKPRAQFEAESEVLEGEASQLSQRPVEPMVTLVLADGSRQEIAFKPRELVRDLLKTAGVTLAPGQGVRLGAFFVALDAPMADGTELVIDTLSPPEEPEKGIVVIHMRTGRRCFIQTPHAMGLRQVMAVAYAQMGIEPDRFDRISVHQRYFADAREVASYPHLVGVGEQIYITQQMASG